MKSIPCQLGIAPSEIPRQYHKTRHFLCRKLLNIDAFFTPKAKVTGSDPLMRQSFLAVLPKSARKSDDILAEVGLTDKQLFLCKNTRYLSGCGGGFFLANSSSVVILQPILVFG